MLSLPIEVAVPEGRLQSPLPLVPGSEHVTPGTGSNYSFQPLAKERMDSQEEFSLLEKIDAISPAPLKSFDAFPKLPSTYRARSGERGFLTLFIAFIAFILVANDIGEFLWGWPDFEFGVDHVPASYLDVNVDMIVNMPCKCAI
jgi:hypothetical protein